METFQKIVTIPEIQKNITQLYTDFEEYLNVRDIREMFQLKYYNKVLIQKQIDVYNAVIKGLNKYTNLYNQQHKETKLPKLKVLLKQILSDKNAISWLPEKFDNDQEVLDAIKDCYERLNENVLGDKILKNLLCNLSKYDTNGIFLRNDKQLTEISQKFFGSWDVIQDAIIADIKKKETAQKKKETAEDYENRIRGIFNKADSFSLEYIDYCLKAYNEENFKATK